MLILPNSILSIEDDNEKAFMEQLYIAYYNVMYRVAFSILRHHQDAEDVVSNTCIALCRKISLLQSMDGNAVHSYIVISIRNTAINLIRKRGTKLELLWGETDYLDSLLSSEEKLEDNAFADIDQDELIRAILQLPLRERNLLERKYILLHPVHEIADDLGVKPGSVLVMLTRTRRKLKELLEEMGHEE